MLAKRLVKLHSSIACCTGHILCGHVAMITKSRPPFPVRDVVMVLGLLLIFLHSCEIKSWSGLGTRLENRNSDVTVGVCAPPLDTTTVSNTNSMEKA